MQLLRQRDAGRKLKLNLNRAARALCSILIKVDCLLVWRSDWMAITDKSFNQTLKINFQLGYD